MELVHLMIQACRSVLSSVWRKNLACTKHKYGNRKSIRPYPIRSAVCSRPVLAEISCPSVRFLAPKLGDISSNLSIGNRPLVYKISSKFIRESCRVWVKVCNTSGAVGTMCRGGVVHSFFLRFLLSVFAERKFPNVLLMFAEQELGFELVVFTRIHCLVVGNHVKLDTEFRSSHFTVVLGKVYVLFCFYKCAGL